LLDVIVTNQNDLDNHNPNIDFPLTEMQSNKILSEVFKHFTDENNQQFDFDYAKDLLRKNSYDERFTIIGNTKLQIFNDNYIYYQITGRHKEESFEFLFNDISKVKITEEANAVIK